MSEYTEFLKLNKGKSKDEIAQAWKEYKEGKESGLEVGVGAKDEEPKAGLEAQLAQEREKRQELEKMVRDLADKGRLLKYDSRKQGKKPQRVHLSKFQGGLIVGWQTKKDVLIKHPTTGKTVGEEQLFEVMVRTDDGKIKKIELNGYPSFSEARYGDRIQVEVVGRKEDYEGNTTLTVKLPEGQEFDLDSRFVN